MQRLSIARSLRLALIGLTIALAVIAAIGLSGLYSARQRYETTLAQSSSLSVAAANLLSTGLVEQEVLRSSNPAATRSQAALAYDAAAHTASTLTRSDPISAQLVAAQLAAEARGRALAGAGRLGPAFAQNGPFAQARALSARLQARQDVRQTRARSAARSASRRAVILAAAAGLLALIAALALITGLISSMRRPLDELVTATESLAAGELERRVVPSGPRELRNLGRSFNAMADDLTSAQRQINEERQRLVVTLESLGDALLVTKPGSTTIATVNPRAAELVPALAVGESADSPDSPLPPLEAALAGEMLIEHRGRTLAVTAAALGSAADGVVWTVRDVSERARLERAKSEFVATASHELRSPLTSIKGFVELLERSPENMSARQREFVEIILKSTNRLVDLVGDLLDVARIDADHVEIQRRPIDVGEAVREVADLMGPRIAEKGQQLGVFISPTLPLSMADPDRVRQIVANLLTNAHLYTPQGGRLHIGVEAERAWIQIVIEDSGVGMSEDEAARAFERFFRGAGGRRAGPGSGLGLAIVKSLVDLHHGQIDLASLEGGGTSFRVLLPAALPSRESAHLLDAIRGRRVLVVDDEPEIAELIAGQLAPLEVETTIATSGREALELMRSTQFDAVTLDILMPAMNGFEVLRAIRADPELRRTPIICVSVFSGSSELAGEWLVSKPIDADELRSVLSGAVTSGRSRVLVVGREQLQPVLEPALDELGIEHHWELSGLAAARVCGERRFEVALVDVSIRNPGAVLQALDLRGRRLRRAVILVSDGEIAAPPGVTKLGMEVVPVDDAAAAVLAALRGQVG